MDKMKRRKEFDYFQFFVEIAQAANKAADYLEAALEKFSVSDLPKQVEAMHKIENDADMMKHEMLTNLAKEFITPIEREDIVALAQELDNVVDAIDDVMMRMYMYNVQTVRGEAIVFARQIVKCTRELLKVMQEFKSFKKSKDIKDHCIEVNTIESDGDKMFAENMRKLWTEKSDDLRQVTVWTTMYEGLENCLDECEDAVDIVESVMMKNS